MLTMPGVERCLFTCQNARAMPLPLTVPARSRRSYYIIIPTNVVSSPFEISARTPSDHGNMALHILGVGAMGGLVACELSTLSVSPRTILLWRNLKRLSQFKEQYGSTIHLDRQFDGTSMQAQFDSECPESIQGPIENLIVTTKTYQTSDALAPYLHLINTDTNVLLIQNGVGVVDELLQDVWPEECSRPRLYQGVINHGGYVVEDEDQFKVEHSGLADLAIAKVGDEADVPAFIQSIVGSKGLVAKYVSYQELLLIQLKKLLVNSCINPITAVVDCQNGRLTQAEGTRDLFHSIIGESVDIFKRFIPELKNTEEAFDVDALVEHVIHVGTVVNAQNSSSMRQDILHNRRTEIDYINGYTVSLAARSGVRAPVNETIANLVRLKSSVVATMMQ